MIISKYTVSFKDSNLCYVYNTLSNMFVRIDDESYDKIVSAQTNKTDVQESDFDKELFDVLSSGKIITENDKDDFLIYKSIIQTQRAFDDFMHLTLAPTMDCCFRCHYCFEKDKEKIYMSPETMDAIIKYVKSVNTLKALSITWFGGEPLMAIKQIEEFYNKIESLLEKLDFRSNIITTGYHLDKEAIRVLKKVKIFSMQITLDGNRETHNKVKNFPGSGDTFERVLTNVEQYNNECPDVNIVFRVNLTKENAHEYEPLQQMILERFKGRKSIAISPAFVQDRSSVGCKPNAMLFNHKSASQYILSLAQKGVDSTYIRYPRNNFYECAIRNKVAIAFDSEGYAYKCWEIIGNKKYSIGRLNTDGVLVNVNHTMLNRQLYGADPLEDPKCRECIYLPLCSGGCPIHRIENEFDGGRNSTCTFHKGYIDAFLREHLKRKQLELDNKMDY